MYCLFHAWCSNIYIMTNIIIIMDIFQEQIFHCILIRHCLLYEISNKLLQIVVPQTFGGDRCCSFFSFLCCVCTCSWLVSNVLFVSLELLGFKHCGSSRTFCTIICLYVISSVLWYPLRFPHAVMLRLSINWKSPPPKKKPNVFLLFGSIHAKMH